MRTWFLKYPKASAFRRSWDLPRSYQDLEVFGWGGERRSGSVYMEHGKVTVRKGKEVEAHPRGLQPGVGRPPRSR